MQLILIKIFFVYVFALFFFLSINPFCAALYFTSFLFRIDLLFLSFCLFFLNRVAAVLFRQRSGPLIKWILCATKNFPDSNRFAGRARQGTFKKDPGGAFYLKPHNSLPFLQMQSPGEKRTGRSRRTSSQRKPASVFWNISTLFRVSRWTLIAISAFSLSGRHETARSSSEHFCVSQRQSNHLITFTCR